ncbi:MAG: hypothetical protein ABIU84_14860 [Thermoanaerobaculia bacterium]
MFALAFVFLAVDWARVWVWGALLGWSQKTPDFSGVALATGKAVTPLLLALFLIRFLWKSEGPPFSPPRGKGPEFRTGREVPAQQGGDAWRSVVWVVMLVLFLGSAGWALLFYVCGGHDMFSVISTSRDGFERLSLGIMAVGGVIFLSLILWAVIGPPFQRPPK